MFLVKWYVLQFGTFKVNGVIVLICISRQFSHEFGSIAFPLHFWQNPNLEEVNVFELCLSLTE